MTPPIRCSNCGCLFIGNLIIPSHAKFTEEELSTNASFPPTTCPLCKRNVDDIALARSANISASLADSNQSRAEISVLIDLLSELHKRQAGQADAIHEIQDRAPKASGITRFIPQADTTSAIALIIAVAALANDVVVDWLVPALKNSGAQNQPSIKPTLVIGDSSIYERPLRKSHRTSAEQVKLRFSGRWSGPDGFALRLVEFKLPPPGPVDVYSVNFVVSQSPGQWSLSRESDIDAGFYNDTDLSSDFRDHVFAFYVNNYALTLTRGQTDADAPSAAQLRAMSLEAFVLKYAGGVTFRLKNLSLGNFETILQEMMNRNHGLEMRAAYKSRRRSAR